MHLKKLLLLIASYPTTVAAAHSFMYFYGDKVFGRKGPTPNDYKQMLLYAFFIPGFMLLHMLGHQNEFDDPMQETANKKKAMYPPVDKEYLSSKPNGFIFGKYQGKYVRIPIIPENILHGCIIGPPGSGKSAGPFLSTLLNCFVPRYAKDGKTKSRKRLKPHMTVFVNDIKPELAYKSVELMGNKYVKVCNPVDRQSVGWNVYYELKPNSPDDEVLRVLDGISRALIVSSNPKDSFFVNNARTIFKGIMLHLYKVEHLGFVDSICELLSHDIQTYIKEILKKTNKESKVYQLLNKYASKTSEAFQDIELTLGEHLDIFISNEDIKWFLRDNGRKADPRDLLKDISIFLSLPEKRLEEMKDVFRLINHQVLHEMENKPDGSRPVCIILDEFARCGKMEQIKESLTTLRSRCVSIWLCFQDLSQMESIYGEDEARQIINLCEVHCILGCRDIKLCNQITEWIGQYLDKKTSYKNSGEHKGEGTTSPEYRDIITTRDIMGLKKKKEVIVFFEGLYYRIDRIRYYEDPVLSKRNKEVVKFNNNSKKRRKKT